MSSLAQLLIEVTLLQNQIYADGQCLVKVSVRNTGTERVVVNGRLAVGYRNSTSRELFADLRHKDNGALVNISAVDYQRDFPKPSDYRTLSPGDAIAATFDFFEWYPPPNAGAYQLVIHYQADEPLANPPKDVVRGIYSSAPVDINVLARTREKK